MKKNKTLIVFLLLQLLFIGSAQAKCDLESFDLELPTRRL